MALALLHAQRGNTDAARALFDPVAGDDFAALQVEASTMVTWTFGADVLRHRVDDQVPVHPIGVGPNSSTTVESCSAALRKNVQVDHAVT